MTWEPGAPGLHPSVLPGGALSPEEITRKLASGATISIEGKREEPSGDPSFVEIPREYLPDDIGGSSFDPVVLRAAAEAHSRHRFDHDMRVKGWVVLWLLDQVF